MSPRTVRAVTGRLSYTWRGPRDWNGDGLADATLYRQGRWYFDLDGTGRIVEQSFRYGLETDVPVAGDWDGGTADDAVVFRSGRWFFDLDGRGRKGEETVHFGLATDVPLLGHWVFPDGAAATPVAVSSVEGLSNASSARINGTVTPLLKGQAGIASRVVRGGRLLLDPHAPPREAVPITASLILRRPRATATQPSVPLERVARNEVHVAVASNRNYGTAAPSATTEAWLAVDAVGNAYVLGYVYFFDSGREDFFVAKYSPAGELLWRHQIGGLDDDRGEAIAVDNVGSVYIADRFQNRVDFNPDPAEDASRSSAKGVVFTPPRG